MQPFSPAIPCDLSVWESHPPDISYPSVGHEGPDGDCTTGPCCGGLRWMSRDSEGCGWCMIVCERGDTGAGPEIACFNLSLWTWPRSQLYSSCSNTCQVSSFLLPTHCFFQIWFLVVGRVQARYDDIIILLKFSLHARLLTHGFNKTDCFFELIWTVAVLDYASPHKCSTLCIHPPAQCIQHIHTPTHTYLHTLAYLSSCRESCGSSRFEHKLRNKTSNPLCSGTPAKYMYWVTLSGTSKWGHCDVIETLGICFSLLDH